MGIDPLLTLIIYLAVAVAIVMVIRWALPLMGVPAQIVNAICLIVAVIVVVVVIRALLPIGGDLDVGWAGLPAVG